MCNKLVMSEKVFDGDTDYRNSVNMESDCNPSFLRVMLGKPSSINYIVIYHGEGLVLPCFIHFQMLKHLTISWEFSLHSFMKTRFC